MKGPSTVLLQSGITRVGFRFLSDSLSPRLPQLWRWCRTGKTAVITAKTRVHHPVTSQGMFQLQGMSCWPCPHQWRQLQQHKEAAGSRPPRKPYAQCDFMSCRHKWQVTVHSSVARYPPPQAHPGITNPWKSPGLDPHFSTKDIVFLHPFWQISLRLGEKVYNSQLFPFSCREPAWGIPPMAKVMRKEARHMQRCDLASGVPPGFSWTSTPENQSLPALLYCAFHSSASKRN